MFRRFIRKNFGSEKVFGIWILFLIISITLIDQLIFKPSYDHQSTNVIERKSILEPEGEKAFSSCVPNICDKGTYSYLIRSGVDKSGYPTICFNGVFIFDMQKMNGKRGLNIVVINDKTLQVDDMRSFDTYTEDAFLIRYLRIGIPDNYIILMASMDDASNSLSVECRKMFMKYGSRHVETLQFRDSFVMIGQKGLVSSQSIEKISVRAAESDYPTAAEISGCLKVPVGELITSKQGFNDTSVIHEIGKGLINCGIQTDCTDHSFPVHLYTGKKIGEVEDMPKMCIDGKYYYGKNLNNVGRGLNIAVVDQNTKGVIHMGRFDTFSSDTTNLEMLMEELKMGDIILVISFDEASTQLTQDVQKQFEEFGSSMINKLSFRDAWVFVGQKGIKGKSPYEKIEYVNGNWPLPIDVQYCVNTHITAMKINEINTKRENICSKYKLTNNFCKKDEVRSFIQPIENKDKVIRDSELYNTLIILIAEMDLVTTMNQLFALFQNPGLKPEKILVICNVEVPDCPLLADAFNVSSIRFKHSFGKMYFKEVLDRSWSIITNKKYLIFLQDGVIPYSDFLSFLAYFYPVFTRDNNLVAMSAWNLYDDGEGLTSSVERGAHFPGLGFILKKNFYLSNIQHKTDCCTNSTWYGWDSILGGRETIYPQSSRVYYQPSNKNIANLTIPERKENKKHAEFIMNILTENIYETNLKKEIKNSHKLEFDKFINSKCQTDSDGESFVLEFIQTSKDIYSNLTPILNCFHFATNTENVITNLHRGMLKLANRGKVFYLIGSLSEYSKLIS